MFGKIIFGVTGGCSVAKRGGGTNLVTILIIPVRSSIIIAIRYSAYLTNVVIIGLGADQLRGGYLGYFTITIVSIRSQVIISHVGLAQFITPYVIRIGTASW